MVEIVLVEPHRVVALDPIEVLHHLHPCKCLAKLGLLLDSFLLLSCALMPLGLCAFTNRLSRLVYLQVGYLSLRLDIVLG